MYGFLIVTLLLSSCVCDPRKPRIYNVLITSKKNLAPSETVPVYEPILRTTSVGLPFPPFFYTPIIHSFGGIPTTYITNVTSLSNGISPLEANTPYYTPHFLSQPPQQHFYPKELPGQSISNEKLDENLQNREQIIANYNVNPGIPNVPPPPLPVKAKN